MIKFIKNIKSELPGILMVLFLPFSFPLPNLFLILGLAVLCFKVFQKKEVVFKPILPFLLFILSVVFVLAIKQTISQDFKTIQRLGIVVLSALIFLNTTRKYILNAFILAVNLNLLISSFKIISHLYSQGSVDLSNGDFVNIILQVERPYFGFMILISSILTFEKIQKKTLNLNMGIGLILLNVFFVFFIAARMTMLTYLIITSWYFFKFLKIKANKKAIILASFIIPVVALSIVNDNLKKRLKIDQGIETFIDYEPRFVIWPCATDLLKQDYSKLIIGPLGFESSVNALRDCYATKIENPSKREWYLQSSFNPHNQFLSILMVSGFFGLILFANFIFQLSKSTTNSFANQAIIIGLSLFLFMECVLNRQLGCYMTGLIISLLSLNNGQQNKNCTRNSFSRRS